MNPLLAALVAGLLTTLALVWLADALPLHQDSSRDLLLAHECRMEGSCHGPPSSLRGVQHAAGWILVLSWLPSNPVMLWKLSVLVHALAAAVTAITLAPHLSWLASLVVSMLAALALPIATSYPILWGPTLTVLPLALMHLALSRMLGDVSTIQRLVFAGLAGASLGLATQGHLVHILGVAVLLVGAQLGPRSPVVMLVAMAAFAATGQPWVLWRLGLSASIAWWAVPAGVLVAVASGAGLRRLGLARSAQGRQRLLWGVCLAGVGGLAVVAEQVHQSGLRYLAVGLLPGLLVAGLLFDKLLAWNPGGLVAVVLALVVVSEPGRFLHRQTSPLNLASTKALADLWRAEGKGLDEATPRLRSPQNWELLPGLAALGLPVNGAPLSRDVRLVVVDGPVRGLLAEAGWVRRVSHGGGGLWESEIDSWLQFNKARSSATSVGAIASPTIEEDPSSKGAGGLAYPYVSAWRSGTPRVEQSDDWQLLVPLVAPDEEERAFVFLHEETRFRIQRVEGLPARVNEDGSCAVVRGPGRGQLTFSTTPFGARQMPFFPEIVEFRAREAELRDGLKRSSRFRPSAPCP